MFTIAGGIILAFIGIAFLPFILAILFYLVMIGLFLGGLYLLILLLINYPWLGIGLFILLFFFSSDKEDKPDELNTEKPKSK